MTTATGGSVFFKLAFERGRYREIVGELLDAEYPEMRETLTTAFRRSCTERDADVEVRGRLYHAPVFVLSDQPGVCFLEADRDGVPVGARETKVGWLDRSAQPYLRQLAKRWSHTESPTHASDLPLASAFIPPRLRLLTSDQKPQQEPGRGWIHWEDLSAHARVVLLGEPGAGKSTCLRRLVYEANLRSDQQVDTLPIYVQLREFTAADLTIEHLRHRLAPQLGPAPPDEFDPPQSGGRILLLLDGLDEIASEDERGALLEGIRISVRPVTIDPDHCDQQGVLLQRGTGGVHPSAHRAVQHRQDRPLVPACPPAQRPPMAVAPGYSRRCCATPACATSAATR